jgi:hypothetical protein
MGYLFLLSHMIMALNLPLNYRIAACTLRTIRAPRRKPCSYPSIQSRNFSLTTSRFLMEVSGFTQGQLDVREAVSKICSQYPDVGTPCPSFANPIDPDRNIGWNGITPESIRTNYIEISQETGGLALHYPKSLEELGWVYQRRP